MPQLSIVVPTYNEGSHIVEFLADVEKAVTGRDYEIVVVDDNSPDGTHAKVADYARAHPRVKPVLRTKEKGLATAVIEGMRQSVGDYVVVMDSDFQHPPEAVPRLLDAALAEHADCVVASRYATGGTVTGFPLLRRIISWGARTLAVVGIPAVRRFKVRDPMSGFFLVRRDRVEVAHLRPLGYKILLEVLARAPLRKVTEVGFAFQNRRAGESKLRMKTQVDYFRHVVQLAFVAPENRRLFYFTLVGASGVVVNLALIELLSNQIGWGDRALIPVAGQVFLLGALVAAIVAREAAILWNFVWNDRFTFHLERRRARSRYTGRLLRFHVVSMWSFLAYLAVYYPLIHFGVPEVPAGLVAILLSFFLNYSGNVKWTYASRGDAHEADAQKE